MYLRSIHITNLRCFRDTRLELQYPGRDAMELAYPNINLLLGNNGAGKSTVMKAIALATLSPIIESAGFVPYYLVRRNPAEQNAPAEVEAEVLLQTFDLGHTSEPVSNAGPLETLNTVIELVRDTERFSKTFEMASGAAGVWELMFDSQAPGFLIVAYGSTRRVEPGANWDESVRARSRALRYQRVASIFEGQVTLAPLTGWLPGLEARDPEVATQAVELLNKLLPDECRFDGKFTAGEYFFELHGSRVPYGALSDGYQAYIGWIADLLYHLSTGYAPSLPLDRRPGIVMVDEIDLHLHPDWQRSVVPHLAAALPHLQFVITTHSPIVAGTLESPNIHVMEMDDTGAAVARQLDENIHGLTAEEILLSSYFNLDTTRAQTAEDELRRLADKARRGDDDAAVEYARLLARGAFEERLKPRASGD